MGPCLGVDHESEHPAHMRRRIRRSGDQAPARTRQAGGHVGAGRSDHARWRRPAILVDDRHHSRHAGGKAARRERAVGGRHDGDAAGQCRSDQLLDQSIERTAEAQIDHLRAAIDRRMQGERKAESRAHASRAPRLRGRRAMPAGALRARSRRCRDGCPRARRRCLRRPSRASRPARRDRPRSWRGRRPGRRGPDDRVALRCRRSATRTSRPVAEACMSVRRHSAAAGCTANSGSSCPSARNTCIGCAHATRGSRASLAATSSGRSEGGTSIT